MGGALIDRVDDGLGLIESILSELVLLEVLHVDDNHSHLFGGKWPVFGDLPILVDLQRAIEVAVGVVGCPIAVERKPIHVHHSRGLPKQFTNADSWISNFE